MSNPPAILSVANVAMKSFIPNFVIRKPLRSPKNVPVATPSKIDKVVGRPDANVHIVIPALNPQTVPIDRSIDPPIITIAAPTVSKRTGTRFVI